VVCLPSRRPGRFTGWVLWLCLNRKDLTATLSSCYKMTCPKNKLKLPFTCPVCGRKTEYPSGMLVERCSLTCPFCRLTLTLQGHMLEECQREIQKTHGKELNRYTFLFYAPGPSSLPIQIHSHIGIFDLTSRESSPKCIRRDSTLACFSSSKG